MAEIIKRGEFSSRPYRFLISGDEPTVDEQMQIDQVLRQNESEYAKQYEEKYGRQLTDEGSGVMNYLGEVPKGIVRGGIGLFESGLLGAAAALPEGYETPVREAIRGGAYALKPQADVGLEESVATKLSEGVGSFLPLVPISMIPVVGGPAALGLGALAGAGEASERARAAGATVEERGQAAALGLLPGAIDILPIKFLKVLGKPATGTIMNRLSRAAAQGGVEGAQEAAQEIAQNLIEQGVYNPDKGTFEGTGESLGYGFGTGALVQALLDLLPGRSAAPSAPPPAAPAPTAAKPLALPPPPRQLPAPAQQAAAAPATIPTPTATPVQPSAVQEDEAVADARYVFDERMAIMQEDGGTDEGTAQVYAAHDAIKYIDSLGEITPSLARFRNLMMKMAAGPLPRTLEDIEAEKAAEAPPQKDLFTQQAETAAAAAPKPTVKLPESKPARILTEEMVDQLGISKAKSAGLRKLVGTSLDNTKVVTALSSWAQNERSTPEQKSLAASLIAPPLIKPKATELKAEDFAPSTDVNPTAEPEAAAQTIANEELGVEPEAANVPQIEEAQSGAMGVGPVSGEQRVGDGGQPAGDIQPAGEPQAPEAGGLGGDLSGAVGTPAAEGLQPPPLTTPARQLIPGTIVPVDKATLQPTGAPRMEQAALYAPERKPGVAGMPSVVADQIRRENLLRRMIKSFMDRTTPGYRAYTSTQGGINNSQMWKENPDWMNEADANSVLALLRRKGAVQPFTEEEAAARTYFEKTVRPVDAISMMVDDLTAPYETYRRSSAAGIEELAIHELMLGTGRVPALSALKWARDNFSPAGVRRIEGLIDVSTRNEAGQLAWVGAEGGADRVETSRRKRKEMREAQAALAEESGYFEPMAAADALGALDKSLHYTVKAALAKGDLRTALRGLAMTTSNPELKRLATKFADMTGTTRVKVVRSGDASKYGQLLADNLGVYLHHNTDPDQQNIILLSEQFGLSAHTLMHEMAHALTFEIVRNQPNHPVTRQLTALMERVRKSAPPRLGIDARTGDPIYPLDYYGLTNVREFVSEAFGTVAAQQEVHPLRHLMSQIYADTFKKQAVELPLTVTERIREIFSNMINRILGRPTKPWPRKTITNYTEETALDAVQRLAEGILSPAPSVLGNITLGNAAYSPRTATNILNWAPKTAPTWNKAGLSRMLDNLRADIPMSLRRFLLGTMQLDWLDDTAQAIGLTGAADLKKYDEYRRSFMTELMRIAAPVSQKLSKLGTDSPEKFGALSNAMVRSTLEEVDLTKPSSNYVGDPEKLRVWNELNRDLNKVDSSGELRDLYKSTRNVSERYREEILKTLDALATEISTENGVVDKRKARSLAAQLKKKIVEEGVIDPFFMLMRDGDYWVEYTTSDTTAAPVLRDPAGRPQYPTTRVVQSFASSRARDAFIQELQAAKDPQGNPAAWGINQFMYSTQLRDFSGVPVEFLQGVTQIIGNVFPAGGGNDAAVKAVQDLFLRMTPSRSMMAAFQRRKGVRGALGDISPLGIVGTPQDFVSMMESKFNSLAYQIAANRYGKDIVRAMTELEKQHTAIQQSNASPGDKAAAMAVYEEIRDRGKFARAPKTQRWAYHARGFTFMMTLGANIAGAMNALFQIPMMGVSQLTGRYKSAPKVMKALKLGSAIMMNATRETRVRTMGPNGEAQENISDMESWGSLENYYEVDADGEYQLRTDRKIPEKLRARLEEMRPLVRMMVQHGMLAHSPAQAEIADFGGKLSRLYQYMGLPLHYAERFNRQTMAIAAYALEVDKLRDSGKPLTDADFQNAALSAMNEAELINGSMGVVSGPRLAQGAIGSLIFLYKRFGLTVLRYITKSVRQAVKGASKEDRNIARYQLGGMMGATALFAGVQGLPFFSEVMQILDMLFTDDDEEDFKTVVQKYLQEPFYSGAVNYLTGAEVASRISMSGLFFRDNQIEKNQNALWDLAEMFGGPTLGLLLNLDRVGKLYSEGEFYRATEALMPAFIRSGMQSLRFATEGAETLRGQEIAPMTAADIAIRMIGYTPAAYARQQEAVSREKRIDLGIQARKRKLLRKHNMALMDRDYEELREIRKEINEFNRQHREFAITSDTLSRSKNQFDRVTSEMISGVSYSANYRRAAEESISEYDPTISIWE